MNDIVNRMTMLIKIDCEQYVDIGANMNGVFTGLLSFLSWIECIETMKYDKTKATYTKILR